MNRSTDTINMSAQSDIQPLGVNGRHRIRKKRLIRRLSKFTIGLTDLLLLSISVGISYWLRFHKEFGVQFTFIQPVPIAPFMEYIKAIGLLDYLSLVLFLLFGMYKLERSRWLIDEIHAIIKSLTLSFLIITSLTFFARREGFDYSRLVFFYSYTVAIIALGTWRYVLMKIEHWFHTHDLHVNRILIVGCDEMARIVASKLSEKPNLGYRIIGFTAPGKTKYKDLEGFPFLGDLNQFSKILNEYRIDEVFISDPELSHFKLLEILSTCEETGVLMKMVPTVYDLLIDFADMNDLDGLPLVAVREQPLYELSLLSKRIFDILISSFILIIFGPVLLITAIAVKLTSPGPVIFTQIRAGVGGHPFKMYKLRTMHIDAEERLQDIISLDDLDEPVFKIQDDPRITPVGRFLRRTSIDEIPQFWNVLKGDMSIVGPRPEETQLVDKYNIWQRRRLKIKPGITGMQQIVCRGTTSLANRIKYDIYYLRKHSLLLDIWIIFRTIPVVISGKGAY